MHPDAIHLGPLSIHWYGIFMAVGFLAGLANWIALGRREKRDVQFCSDLLFWIILSGIGGARLAYILADWRYFLARPAELLRVDRGGLIYYGGFLASAVALIVFARRRREPILRLLDFVITSVPLAHAFGRIGCLINGCCYGAVCTLPWAVRFPEKSLPWWHQVDQKLIERTEPLSLPVHPVQLYESAANVLLYLLILAAYRQTGRRDGAVTALYLTTYPVMRFITEFFRGTDRVLILGLPTAQVVSLALFALGLGIWALVLRRSPAATAGTPSPS